MWNILVQYHMIFREHIFKKFQLYGNYKDEYISPEQEFLKLAVLKDFMEVSRVKQLQQLSESLVKITLPKLNQGNSGGQHDFDCEKLMLILLDMLKQFLFYYVTSSDSTPKYNSILYDQEKVIIKQRIIMYMIQRINISDLNFDEQFTLSGMTLDDESKPDGLYQFKYFTKIKEIIEQHRQVIEKRAENGAAAPFWLED